MDSGQLLFQNKSVKGFWATQYLKDKSLLSIMSLTNRVAAMCGQGDLPMEVQWHAKLDEGYRAVREYVENMSRGKVLFTFDWKPEYDAEPRNAAPAAAESAAPAAASEN